MKPKKLEEKPPSPVNHIITSRKSSNAKSLKSVLHPDAAPPKLTATVILREEKMIKKALEDEQKRLENIEIGLKDLSQFEQTEQQLKLRDEQERLLEIERKRLQVQLIHEEAVLAKQDAALERK
jgi:hypothetical protein